MRLDAYLSGRSLVRSRERAKTMIKAGCIKIDGKVCTKPSAEVSDANKIEIDDSDFNYVGRGLLKLAAAFGAFDIDVTDKVCADIGASTGGFTQCMLEHGARLVYAVDVGHDQLDEQLKSDSRVVNMENTDIRAVTPEMIGGKADLITADVSFISLRIILPTVYSLLSDTGCAAVLIKPQFEAGRSGIGKNGIVKDRRVHVRVLTEINDFAASVGFCCGRYTYSPVRGGSGNIEYLVMLTKGGAGTVPYNFRELVDSAFETL